MRIFKEEFSSPGFQLPLAEQNPSASKLGKRGVSSYKTEREPLAKRSCNLESNKDTKDLINGLCGELFSKIMGYLSNEDLKAIALTSDENFQRIKELEQSQPVLESLFLDHIINGSLDLEGIKNFITTYDIKLNNQAILQAVNYGRFDLVKYFLSDKNNGIEPEKVRLEYEDGDMSVPLELPSDYYKNLIALAAENGLSEIVKLLLADGRVSPGAMGNLAISLAVKNGYLETVQILLADERIDPSIDDHGIFEWAAIYNHLEIIRYLIKDGSLDPNTYGQQTGIEVAGENSNLEMIKLLLTSDKIKTNKGLLSAVNAGHPEAAELFLIDGRANPMKLYHGNSAFLSAAQNGYTEIIKLIIEKYGIQQLQPEDLNNNALVLAAQNGHAEVVELLANICINSLNSAFQKAFNNGHFEIVKYLSTI